MSAGREEALVILLGRAGEQYADPDDWRALIRAGRLRRMDSVAARRPGGTTYQRADAVPELLALFEDLDAAPSVVPAAPVPAPEALPPVPLQPEQPPPSPPPPQGTAPEERSRRIRITPAVPVTLNAAKPEPRRAPEADRRGPPRPEPRRVERRPRRERRRGCGLGGLILLALLGFGAVQLVRWIASERPVAGAEAVTAYATRETRVRPEPATGNTPLGVVPRGERLRGEWVDGRAGDSRWLRIAGGRYEGGYAWGANLASKAPPRLVEVIDAERATVKAGPVLAAPSDSAERVAEVETGRKLRVAGRTEDGWMEITRSGGGVGYMRADVFGSASGETLSVEVVDEPVGQR